MAVTVGSRRATAVVVVAAILPLPVDARVSQVSVIFGPKISLVRLSDPHVCPWLIVDWTLDSILPPQQGQLLRAEVFHGSGREREIKQFTVLAWNGGGVEGGGGGGVRPGQCT